MKKTYIDKGLSFMNYLMSLNSDITPEIAAGIVGNLMQESTLSHTAVNSSGYRGLAQWDPNTRWPAYLDWLSSNSLKDSPESQLKYIIVEPSRYSFDTVNKMTAKTGWSVRDAALYFLTKFERSGEGPEDKGYQNRIRFADTFYNSYLESRTGIDFRKEYRVSPDLFAVEKETQAVMRDEDVLILESIKTKDGKSLMDKKKASEKNNRLANYAVKFGSISKADEDILGRRL